MTTDNHAVFEGYLDPEDVDSMLTEEKKSDEIVTDGGHSLMDDTNDSLRERASEVARTHPLASTLSGVTLGTGGTYSAVVNAEEAVAEANYAFESAVDQAGQAASEYGEAAFRAGEGTHSLMEAGYDTLVTGANVGEIALPAVAVCAGTYLVGKGIQGRKQGD